MTTTLEKNPTQELISCFEFHKITDITISLTSGGRFIHLDDGEESVLPSLTDDEEKLVLNWLEEKNIRFSYIKMNGLIWLDNGHLRFSGEGQDWVEVSV